MRFMKRATPWMIMLGVVLAGCAGKDSPEPKKPFEGPMPTAGSAELTLGIPME
jgi:hypothetical protein